FALPIIQLLDLKHNNQKHIRALILTPTRELAVQVSESFQTYGQYTNVTQAVIFGGVSQHAQVTALQKGIDVLIATPGRLLDLMNQG
ncbi:DEAD/DEAH box helicase, partial [Salmonella sp. SAL4436]|uniref:DEAD/DEAH box helicase n=1 Tax=Salmonella sp. SAL4436 TaxID=3159891 RepID=UPI00397CD0C4